MLMSDGDAHRQSRCGGPCETAKGTRGRTYTLPPGAVAKVALACDACAAVKVPEATGTGISNKGIPTGGRRSARS